MRLGADRSAGLAVAALGGYVAWGSTQYPFGTLAEPGPGMLPLVLASVLMAFGVLLAASERGAAQARTIAFADLPHAALVIGLLAAAAVGLERIGYRATVIALLFVFIAVVERRNVLVALAVAAGIAFGSFYLINTLLRVPLPVGPWGF